MVAVSVPVMVSIASSTFCPVEYKRHIAELPLLVDILQLREHTSLKQPGPDNEDSPVRQFLKYLGICHYIYRRTIDKNTVIPSTQVLQH